MLYLRYQDDLYYTPYEAETNWAKGEFVWGLRNWELRPCADYLLKLDKERRGLEARHDAIRIRINEFRERTKMAAV